jgi:hypothetical protein
MLPTWNIVGMGAIFIMISTGAQRKKLELVVEEVQQEMEELKSELKDAKKVNVEQCISQVGKELGISKHEFEMIKDELNIIKEHQMVMNQNLEFIKQLESDVSLIKDPPFTLACGYYDGTFSKNAQTIPYTKLLYYSSNVEGASMDTDTGVFVAGHPRSYTVTWTGIATNDAGDYWVMIYLRKNGLDISESYYGSHYTGPSGLALDQGGRTLVVHLDRGDTLELYCKRCDAGFGDPLFCVSLSQFDVI